MIGQIACPSNISEGPIPICLRMIWNFLTILTMLLFQPMSINLVIILDQTLFYLIALN